MKKLERLGEAVAPDGTVLVLYRHDGAYMIHVNGIELMSTRRHHSEDRLADLACGGLREVRGARVLVGGLGMGFTLRAALPLLAPDAEVVVVELLDGVIAWNRNADYPLASDALGDPRVTLRHADVAAVLRERGNAYDAIMLDVDNGAEAFTTAGNAALYALAGVRVAAAALRPGGRLVYWSAQDDPRFADTLRRAGLAVETVRARAHKTSGAWHTLFVARGRDARVRGAAGA